MDVKYNKNGKANRKNWNSPKPAGWALTPDAYFLPQRPLRDLAYLIPGQLLAHECLEVTGNNGSGGLRI